MGRGPTYLEDGALQIPSSYPVTTRAVSCLHTSQQAAMRQISIPSGRTLPLNSICCSAMNPIPQMLATTTISIVQTEHIGPMVTSVPLLEPQHVLPAMQANMPHTKQQRRVLIVPQARMQVTQGPKNAIHALEQTRQHLHAIFQSLQAVLQQATERFCIQTM